MRNAGLDEAQAGIKNAGRNINNLRQADDTTMMAEIKEELKRLSMKVKQGSKIVGLKLDIQKTKIMASGPITSWHIDKEIMETVTDFIFLGSKITSDCDYSHEIMTLAPQRKSYDYPRQHIKKQRPYFADRSIQSKLFECTEIDAFELWCWRRLLRVPWTARRTNQSTLKEMNPEYSLQGLMLKLKLQYFGHLM